MIGRVPLLQPSSGLDIAIVGAAKSGTSSLFSWLDRHPDVQGSEPKETFYFADPGRAYANGDANFNHDGWSGFERYFSAPAAGRLRLEASTVNLHQETAMRAFAGLAAPPLIVASLRCPAAQIRSGFYYNRNYGRIADDLSFRAYASALLDDDFGSVAGAIRSDRDREILAASMSWNRYVDWLDRWHQMFPADRILVVGFEQVADSPLSVLQEIARRAGIDADVFDREDLTAVNRTPAQVVPEEGLLLRLGRRAVPRGRLRTRLARWHQERRTGGSLGDPQTEDDEVLDRLGDHFADANAELRRRYGVDTSAWRSGGSVSAA